MTPRDLTFCTSFMKQIKIIEFLQDQYNLSLVYLYNVDFYLLLGLFQLYLKMENGQVIPYVDSCKHLGNEISMNRMNVFINNATNDSHCRLNSLLADFSHCDSVTLSTLFKTYCMNLYGSQMWRYNDKTTRSFYT